ncbi:MAG: hypothetical protein L3J56_06000, partial [Bacteroidales bacterium]|nr:hypothetical protein [Bacteroidales bacterium]
IYINKTKKGFEYLKKALKIFRELNLNDEISVMTDLGDGYKYVNNTDSSAYYLTKAYKLAIKTNDTYYIKETLRLLFELYDKNNKYKNALFFYKTYVTFKDSIDNEKMKKALSDIEIKYQTSEKEKEIIRLKDKELLEKANTRLLIIGIISLIIIFILIIIRIQTKRKKDSEIQRQKILVHRKEKELVKAKLEHTEIEEKRLKIELEFKTKQLVTHALNMMQKNKLLQEISNHISAQANTLDSEEKKHLFRIKKQLEQGLNIDKDWDLFKIYFEQLNEAFFVKLKEINPKLTGNDFRLCALTKLNLSLKETASVLNISPESAKNARYRLKKKLRLKEGENLNRFLNSL